MDRILPDSGELAKTMMEGTLADLMQEVGYGFCARFIRLFILDKSTCLSDLCATAIGVTRLLVCAVLMNVGT